MKRYEKKTHTLYWRDAIFWENLSILYRASFFVLCPVFPVAARSILLEQKMSAPPFPVYANASSKFNATATCWDLFSLLYTVYLSIRQFGSRSCSQIRTVRTSLFPIVKHDLDRFVVIFVVKGYHTIALCSHFAPGTIEHFASWEESVRRNDWILRIRSILSLFN